MSIDHSSSVKSRLLEQAIDEAMEDLAHRNEARALRESERVTPTRNRWALIGLTIALPVLVLVVVWNVAGVRVSGLPLIGMTATRSEVEYALRTVVGDIEAFEADYGELPASLAELGLPTAGEWNYTRMANDQYRLVVTLGGHVVTFDGRR